MAHQKDLAFGIRLPGGVKVWPLARFAGGAVLNERVSLRDVVLVGNAATRTVRACVSGAGLSPPTARMHCGQPTDSGRTPRRRSEPRRATLPDHVAYRFARDGYFGAEAEAS